MNAKLQAAALHLQEALDRQESAHRAGCGVFERMRVGNQVQGAQRTLRSVLAELGLCEEPES
jgi:hypothetical protein